MKTQSTNKSSHITSKSLATAVAVALSVFVSSHSQAATNPWVGDNSNSFTDPLNWTGDVFPNPGTDIFSFTSTGLAGNITNSTVTLTNTGTAAGTSLGQILFSGDAPARTLNGGTITLGTAATNTYNNAIVLSSGSTVTQTIGSNIVIDDGKAYTASVVNASTSGSGALLKFTGNITGGSVAGTPGVIALGFGNTTTHNGDYEVTGNITAGGSTGVNITKRGTGVLTLSGTNTLGNGTAAGLAQNEAGTIRINGGTTTLNNVVDGANGFGGNNVASTLQVSSGTLNVAGARNVRTNILVDGGTFNIGAGGRLGLDAGRSFTMSAGAVNLNSTTGFGVRFGGDGGAGAGGVNGFTGTQSGGVFTVVGKDGRDTVFSLGSNSAGFTTSYTLSDGTLDIQGSTGTAGFLTIGADNTAGTSNTTFNLSGGKLVVRSATTGSAIGINGRQATGAFAPVQVFSMTGGTLVAGNIDATNLRGTALGTNGTIVNNGSTIAPGDVGSVGRTNVVGALTLTTGVLSIDLGGTTASTIFQETSGSGKFDNIAVSGLFILGGTLSVNLVDGFTPLNSNSFIIATTGSSFSGNFTNVVSGGTISAGSGTFTYTLNSNNITLSNFTAVPEPSTYIGGGLILGLAAWSQRKRWNQLKVSEWCDKIST